jgi:hypothetical protein
MPAQGENSVESGGVKRPLRLARNAATARFPTHGATKTRNSRQQMITTYTSGPEFAATARAWALEIRSCSNRPAKSNGVAGGVGQIASAASALRSPFAGDYT